jgi:hypothetical protein
LNGKLFCVFARRLRPAAERILMNSRRGVL